MIVHDEDEVFDNECDGDDNVDDSGDDKVTSPSL